jgi:O-antigen ligase
MFTAENVLGLYLSMGMAAVAMLPRWWLRLPGFAIVGFAISWSSARNSMFAAGLVLLLGGVVWALTEFGRRRAASAVARLAAVGAVVMMCTLPLSGWLSLSEWDDEAYTGRGVIWNGSLSEWSSRSLLFGLGRDWYERVARSETSPLASGAFQGHNQFVQWLTTGGILLAFIAVAWLLVQAFAITVPASRYLPIAAMLVTGMAVSGWLEVPMGFIDNSVFWTVTVVPLTVLFLARREDTYLEVGAR